MKRISLTEYSWQLSGWRPFAWQIGRSMEIGIALRSDVAALPARLPGSVQANLLAAGWLKDWNVGLNALEAEWVENRHWEFSTKIEAGVLPFGEPVFLRADGFDYSGWILVDYKIVAAFSGALKRHRIDLTAPLGDGKEHVLGIVFDSPPDEQGQVGFTVRSKHFKPRYNYSWDFCARMVPVGIWDDFWLETGSPVAELVKVTPRLSDDFSTGRVSVEIKAQPGQAGAKVVVSLLKDGRDVASVPAVLAEGTNVFSLAAAGVELWWPNNEGAHPLYDVVVQVADEVIGKARVGFKHVRWTPCENGPEGALPWICEVNGRPIFLQGVNWTPIRLDYHSVTTEQYRQRIGLYQEMGCNILRVWGGAFLERETFYNLCDEAGLMVFQEFPLCSSGIDNWPPEDEAAIAEVTEIARDYIRRRGHHASRLLWCGGNELQHAAGRKDGVGIPITEAHPCIAALAKVVAEEDEGTRFVPSSSSGPSFFAAERNYGKGLHHDVHGPWNLESLDQWKKYWSGDDALLRSETGMPGAASLESIERYCGSENPWPPRSDNRYYMHTCSWWLQWDLFREKLQALDGREGLKRYVELSQSLQAEALAIAVRTCRDRFPKCGGVILWMGHDVFPCPINTSVIDFDGVPKPAYHAVKALFLESASVAKAHS